MVSDDEILLIADALSKQNRQWKIKGEYVTPTTYQIRQLLEDCIQTIRNSEESLSIEFGGLLVKQSDGWIDIYTHLAELEYNED